jgi:hypothetical protein
MEMAAAPPDDGVPAPAQKSITASRASFLMVETSFQPRS